MYKTELKGQDYEVLKLSMAELMERLIRRDRTALMPDLALADMFEIEDKPFNESEQKIWDEFTKLLTLAESGGMMVEHLDLTTIIIKHKRYG